MAKRNSAAAPVLSTEDIGSFAQACVAIGNSVADEHGFISVRSLLKRFHASLLIRPLLVEGMLATQPGNQSEWTVLVDSERYGITPADVEEESVSRPLPNRLRFTIAHELAHSLAFRPSDFGIQLSNSVNVDSAKSAVVKAIEKLTHRLTPLLLLSEKGLTQFFCGNTPRTAAVDIAMLGRQSGISRHALIGGLCALSPRQVDQVSRYSLMDIAICIAEWRERDAVIRKWPLFVRFERNVLPEFLISLRSQDRMSAQSAFADSSFVICGGNQEAIELSLPAGSSAAPNAERIAVHCSVERTARSVGTEFFLVVRKRPITQPAVPGFRRSI